MRNKLKETKKYATPSNIHTCMEKGDANVNKLGGTGSGFRYRILIPRFMKGIVKSTAPCLSEVIVKSVIAKCALYKETNSNLTLNSF